MSELRAFLSWCAKAENSDKKDTFGRPLREANFPYGTVSWWIHEYENRDK